MITLTRAATTTMARFHGLNRAAFSGEVALAPGTDTAGDAPASTLRIASINLGKTRLGSASAASSH
jgi:hypothetical protein